MTNTEKAKKLVSLMTTEEAASELSYDSAAIERLNIPAMNWWNEGLHGLARSGVATVFPQAIALAAAFDRELIRDISEIISVEARAKYNEYIRHGDRDIYKGLTLWSPNINIFRDPRWGRGQETYGEDPYLTAELGKAFIKGLHGEGEYIRAAGCAKHFAVHSGPEALRHEFNAKVSEKDLEETYLYAFRELVKAGADGVMGAYNRVNDEASCASSYLMNKLKEWGFDGYFVSDCWAIRDFHEHHRITNNAVESAAKALKSGCDLNCGCTYAYLLAALDEGLISENDIRKAAEHLFKVRYDLGIMGEKTEYDDIPYTVVSCREHKKVSLKAAERSAILLENNGILPLDEDKYKIISVIGPNARNVNALEGNYCGTADRYSFYVDAIADRFNGRVLYAEGCHLYKDRVSGLARSGDRYAEAVSCAENSDLVILCTGLDPTIEGEEGDASNEFSSGDKKDLYLPESQKELIRLIENTGKPLIIVNTSGSAINTLSHPDALIQMFYPGSEGGTALAEILFGDVSPSGKLPVTFYKSAENLPDFTDYSMNNRTYRFLENDENVLYPFGYGLCYADIVCSALKFENGLLYADMENKSDIFSEYSVLAYIKDFSEYGARNKSLCGFERISMKPHEKKTVEIRLNKDAFTSVNEFGERKIFGNRFEFSVEDKKLEVKYE